MQNEEGTRLLTIGQVVARLAGNYPDVTPSSLRFLEREGLVEPERTPGGHRLYSNTHVEQVRRIKEWQRERLSLAEIRERLQAAKTLPCHQDLARSFMDHAMQGDAAGARRTVLSAYNSGMPLAEIYDDVLRPALYEVGRRWADGDVTIVQEHELSAIVRDLIGELVAETQRPTTPSDVILAACVAGETHDLGLRMVSHLLETEGYSVHFLGANVPADSILDGARMRRATIVLLSTTLEENIPELIATLRALNTLPPDERPRIIVGGQVLIGREGELAELGAESAHGLSRGHVHMAEHLTNLLAD
ncbi:MAG: cobalamin B12-binding domain-containing protein [Chloroflexia bacterium]|nr:cobalamin B12-binding domain-containing protein [Chloroflexia bacterium]